MYVFDPYLVLLHNRRSKMFSYNTSYEETTNDLVGQPQT